jgi:hypothetical protein
MLSAGFQGTLVKDGARSGGGESRSKCWAYSGHMSWHRRERAARTAEQVPAPPFSSHFLYWGSPSALWLLAPLREEGNCLVPSETLYYCGVTSPQVPNIWYHFCFSRRMGCVSCMYVWLKTTPGCLPSQNHCALLIMFFNLRKLSER